MDIGQPRVAVVRLEAGRESDGLILRSHWEPGGEVWLEVVHAEPRALFSGVLLRMVRRGEALPYTECSRASIGGVVKIHAHDRTLIYRLVEKLPHDVYAGEWPD